MASIQLRIDLRDVHDALAAARRAATPPGVTEALTAAMEVYQDGARRRAPRGGSEHPGHLRDSLQLVPGGPTEISVETSLVYAAVQEFGATIRPTRRRFLTFVADGRIRFARQVRIRAQPYFLPTFDADSTRAESAFFDVFDEHFTK